jgi:hypothetical protein
MKLSIKKESSTTVAYGADHGGAGKATRPVSVSDTYGMGKPTRTNPVGGFMAMHCYSGSSDQKKSPTSKPGNAGGKRIV